MQVGEKNEVHAKPYKREKKDNCLWGEFWKAEALLKFGMDTIILRILSCLLVLRM